MVAKNLLYAQGSLSFGNSKGTDRLPSSAGLWQTSFSDAVKNGTIYSMN